MTFEQTIMEHEEEAREKGLEEGMEKLAKLINILVAKGRNDDVTLVTNNKIARNRLLAEFGEELGLSNEEMEALGKH